MSRVLKPWQEDALAYAVPKKRIALFLEMRLGKSLVAIRWATARRLQRVLLLAPLNTLPGDHQWMGELQREGVQTHYLPGRKRWDQMLHEWSLRVGTGFIHRRPATGWFLLNYEAVLARPEILSQAWDAIVLDESTRVRNPQAETTKLLLRHTTHIPHRAVLSGLPNPENPLDFFCQFQFLDGGFMGCENYWNFRGRFFHEGYSSWDWQPNPGTRARIRIYVQRRAFLLYRSAVRMGSTKIRQRVRVPISKAQRTAMRTMKREFALDGRTTKWTTVVHTWLQKVAGGFHPITNQLMSDRKLQALTATLRRFTKRSPVVVWFRFNHEIEAAYAYLRRTAPRLRVAAVHGTMKDSKRKRVIDQARFQAGQLDVILLQVALARFGWNLSRANAEIYYSNSYAFEDRNQSEDRIIHMKKTIDCYVIDLVTEHSMDEDVVEAVSSKRMTARMFGRRLRTAAVRHVKRAA